MVLLLPMGPLMTRRIFRDSGSELTETDDAVVASPFDDDADDVGESDAVDDGDAGE